MPEARLAPWQPPGGVQREMQRPDGARLQLASQDAYAPLTELIRRFLDDMGEGLFTSEDSGDADAAQACSSPLQMSRISTALNIRGGQAAQAQVSVGTARKVKTIIQESMA